MMRKAIAIDFDGCLCTDAYPAIGEPNWAVIEKAKQERERGTGLILWTCREGKLLDEALNACQRWGLSFDAVNESLPQWIEAWGNNPRKVGASEYWDDRAVKKPDTAFKLDRIRWEGCPFCRGKEDDGKDENFIPKWRYCDVCGRPLTALAWIELEQRIGGNDEKNN